jgi:pyrroline-5-carboxylate reductase
MLMIGCGAMGKAMLARWLHSNALASVTIVKPTPLVDEWWAHTGVKCYETMAEVPTTPACIVLAVKPQMILQIMPEVRARFGITPLYITIAAGITLSSYRMMLGENIRLIRAMPNTPVAIGAGVTSLTATDTVTDSERESTEMLFAALGSVAWLESEAHMDIATALAGSGPAYAYLFMEALVEAGVAHGLSVETAKMLVMQTMLGSVQLAVDSVPSLQELRAAVTSKGGTTEAALQQFMENGGLFSLTASAINAALKRADSLNAALCLTLEGK